MTQLYLIICFLFFRNVLFSEAPENFQMSIQDPATPALEGMLEFHHYIMFCIIQIGICVVWFLVEVYVLDQHKNLFSQKIYTRKYSWNFVNNFARDYFTFNSCPIIFSSLFFGWIKRSGNYVKSYGFLMFNKIRGFFNFLHKNLIFLLFVLLFAGECYYLHAAAFRPDLNQILWDFMVTYQDAIITWGFLAMLLPAAFLCRDESHTLKNALNGNGPMPLNPQNVLTASADVLHSWTVPSFYIKPGVCPGTISETSLFVKRTGVFYGQCSEICGVNHGFMPIVAQLVSEQKHFSWCSSKLLDAGITAIQLRPIFEFDYDGKHSKTSIYLNMGGLFIEWGKIVFPWLVLLYILFVIATDIALSKYPAEMTADEKRRFFFVSNLIIFICICVLVIFYM